jgi:hypothetical protein
MGTKLNENPPNFEKEFTSLTALPAKQLTAEFEKLVRRFKETTETDDISLIILEIQ